MWSESTTLQEGSKHWRLEVLRGPSVDKAQWAAELKVVLLVAVAANYKRVRRRGNKVEPEISTTNGKSFRIWM